MEKQADHVDKVEGATSLVSEKEEDEKKEAVPGEGATAIDLTKEENTEGAVLAKQDSASLSQATLSSTSPASTSQESIAAPDQQSQTQEANPSTCSCTSEEKLKWILAAVSVVVLCVGIWFLQKFIRDPKAEDDFNYLVPAVLFFLLAAVLWIAICSIKKKVTDSAARSRGVYHYEDLRSEAGSEDIENPRIESSGSEYLEATDKQQDGSDQSTAGPSQEGASSSGVSSEKRPILQPTTSKSDSVMKLSEIASAVSQIASGTTQEGPEKSVQEKPKDQIVSEKADDNLQKDSEQEGLSSTELRHRNFQNPDSCTDLTKTAEAKE